MGIEDFKKSKRKGITIRLDEDVLQKIDELVDHIGADQVDRSSIIRVFVNDGLTNSELLLESMKEKEDK